MTHSYITCACCGKQEDLEIYRHLEHPLVNTMLKKQLCFDCVYWMKWAENPEADTIVVDNVLYHLDKPMEQPSRTRLRALKHCNYLYEQATGQIWVCTAMTKRGRIPEHFQQYFPQKYIFIDRREYYSILNRDMTPCMSKGCFDRYHCVWYRPEIAEPDGPWNTVPDDYAVGTEECPIFINKDKILYDIR